MFHCKDMCKKFKVRKPLGGDGRYGSGQKWCKVCNRFMNHDEPRCPCCSCKLRTSPRSTKLRESLRIIKRNAKVKEISETKSWKIV